MKQVLVIADQSEDSTIARCNAVGAVIQRLNGVEGHHVAASTPTETDVLQALQFLWQFGLLTFRSLNESVTELWYAPSRSSRKSVWTGEPQLGLTAKILEEHRKKFRVSEGAIFRFPLVGSTGFIEAFITDWSPFPAAAAIAVHQDHVIAREVGQKHGNYFTGRFVRHPLTGDILPVWVADWVKPEFGTGAVIVNPAHDSTDLEFARTVGLPIRFALVPQTVTSAPETWPNPPIIKQGTTIKTGRFDGLSTADAVQAYFASLSEQGFAEKVTDLSVGAWKIASYEPSPTGNAVVFEGECRLEPLKSSGIEAESQEVLPASKIVNIKPTELFRSLLSINNEASLEFVVPKAEIGDALLFTRLVWLDLKGHPLIPKQIISVQKIEIAKASEKLTLEDLNLAAISKFPLNQVAVIKQQVLDQVISFNRRHQELLENTGALSNLPDNPQGSLWKQVVMAKDALLKLDLQNAFSSIFSLQKAISKLSSDAQSEEVALSGYYALAYLLTDCKYPEAFDLPEVWRRI
jgi:leucyl-tRNA synthetase